MADPTSRITTLTVHDRQALTTALLLLEAYQGSLRLDVDRWHKRR